MTDDTYPKALHLNVVLQLPVQHNLPVDGNQMRRPRGVPRGTRIPRRLRPIAQMRRHRDKIHGRLIGRAPTEYLEACVQDDKHAVGVELWDDSGGGRVVNLSGIAVEEPEVYQGYKCCADGSVRGACKMQEAGYTGQGTCLDGESNQLRDEHAGLAESRVVFGQLGARESKANWFNGKPHVVCHAHSNHNVAQR
jgi:hypothetical protein